MKTEYNRKKEAADYIMSSSYDRPVGISVMAILLLFSGALLLVTQLLALNALTETSSGTVASNGLLQGIIAFLGLVGTGAGVGTIFGKKWAWWLALLYFAYGVFRNANGMFFIDPIARHIGELPQNLGMYYVKYGVRMVWDLLLIIYLFRNSVMTYFRVTDTKKWRALLIVCAIHAALFVICSFL